jgi:hypothetical protein
LAGANLNGSDARGSDLSDSALEESNTHNLIRANGHIDNLNLAADEKLAAYPDVPIPLQINSPFSIAPTATLDLTDNVVVIDYAGTSPIGAVREKLLEGRGGPGLGKGWNGSGITSSTAAAANQTQPEGHSIGYAENTALPLGALTDFHGVPIDNTSILIAYTRTGDANLDGVVNDDDVTVVGATYAPGVPQPSWALGDFDYNGFVDDDDITLVATFYDALATPIGATALTAPVASGVTAIPEPSTLLLLVLGMCTATCYGMRFCNLRR